MCASAPLFENPVSIFPYARWARQMSALTKRYRENVPIPHILLKDFLDDETARHAMQEFPTPSTQAWTHYEHQNENKLGMTERGAFPPSLGLVVDELNSPSVCGLAFRSDWHRGPAAGPRPGRCRAPSIRLRRIPERAHGLLSPPLPKELAAAHQSHSVLE